MALIVINRPVVSCTEHEAPKRRSSWRLRGLVLGSVLAVTASAVAVTAAVAGPGGQDTTSVSFVALNPAKKIMSNVNIAANKTVNVVVIGGSTTVPTDATTVQLSVSVTGTASGDLNFYPAGNVGGGSGQYIAFGPSNPGSGVVEENPGQVGELTFYNVSSAAAHVTATITGWSTQVTAGDVNGSGGTAGQALVNNGDGTASWGSAPPSSYTNITITGHQFTGLNFVQVQAVSVPAGDYDVTYTASVVNTGPAADIIFCYINGTAPNDVGQIVEKTGVPGNGTGEIVAQAITKAAVAGSITVTCADTTGTSQVSGVNNNLAGTDFPILTAVAVNAHGVYSNN